MTKPATPQQARSPFARSLPALAVATLMAGCSLAPTYERPPAPVAADWPAPRPAAPASATRPASELPWADFVGDASLRELIRLALVNNRDLRVAVLNIEQARATWQIRRADQFPTVNLGATGAVQPRTDGSGGTTSAYTAGLSFTGWELDLFGRVASLKDAALAQYLASEEARRAVQASLIAAVANTWLNLQTNDELLAITLSTLKTREDSLRLTQLRLDNGASSALDVRQAESLTAGALAALQQQQRQVAVFRLQVRLQHINHRANAAAPCGRGQQIHQRARRVRHLHTGGPAPDGLQAKEMRLRHGVQRKHGAANRLLAVPGTARRGHAHAAKHLLGQRPVLHGAPACNKTGLECRVGDQPRVFWRGVSALAFQRHRHVYAAPHPLQPPLLRPARQLSGCGQPRIGQCRSGRLGRDRAMGGTQHFGQAHAGGGFEP